MKSDRLKSSWLDFILAEQKWFFSSVELTFTKALEAFRTAMSFRFFDWLTYNQEVFAAYQASLGFIWA